MKLQVRQGVFETNSSSTHVISISNGMTIVDSNTMKKWKDGELYITGSLQYGNCEFIDEAAANKLRPIDNYRPGGSFNWGPDICMTYDEFEKEMEHFNEWGDGEISMTEYTTKGGETITIILMSTGEEREVYR